MNDNQELKDHLTVQPLDYTPATAQPKPQLTIPWPAILFITGLAIGFIFGITR